MNGNPAKHKSPAFKAFLRAPSPASVNLLNHLRTDDFGLLTRLALKIALVHGGIKSGASKKEWNAFVHPPARKSTSAERKTRKQLENDLLRIKRNNLFTHGTTFRTAQPGDAWPAPRWLRRFRGIEAGLRAALKKLPTYSRLCVCKECEKFFIRKTARYRDYCSRKCAGRVSARATMQRNRATERAMELERVRIALKSCPPGRDPKAWAAKKARVSKNWITYAAARGDLKLKPRPV